MHCLRKKFLSNIVILLGKNRVAIHSFLVELWRPTQGHLLLGERPEFGCHVLIQDALI